MPTYDTTTGLSALTGSNLISDIDAGFLQLATDTSTAIKSAQGNYRTIHQAQFLVAAQTASTTKWAPGPSGTLVASGSTLGPSATPAVFGIDTSEYAFSGLSGGVRFHYSYLTNGTAPNATGTLGIYPVTMSAGAFSLGTAVGSTLSLAALAANQAKTLTSSVGALSGFVGGTVYALGLSFSANTALNSFFVLRVAVQVHQA